MKRTYFEQNKKITFISNSIKHPLQFPIHICCIDLTKFQSSVFKVFISSNNDYDEDNNKF